MHWIHTIEIIRLNPAGGNFFAIEISLRCHKMFEKSISTTITAELSGSTQSWQYWHLFQMHHKYSKIEKNSFFS